MKNKRIEILHLIENILDESDLTIKDKFLVVDSLTRKLWFEKAMKKKGN